MKGEMEKLRILLSNDDGYDAEGIKTLYNVLKNDHDVTIVAPSEERSASGQTLTLDHPVRIYQHEENVYSTSGYPSDCTLLGALQVLDRKPDLVISGINHGANLAQDIYYSGTVAAARQGVFNGIPSIAISTCFDAHFHELAQDELYFTTAADFISKFIEKGLYQHIDPMTLLNINVPNLKADLIKGVESTSLSMRTYSEDIEHRFDARNREYFWLGGNLVKTSHMPETDCHAIEQGKISINSLKLIPEFTDQKSKWSELIDNLV